MGRVEADAVICAAILALQPFDIAPTVADVCPAVVEAAHAYHVPPEVLVSIAWHESRFRPDVVSSVGAAGPLQVMPQLQTGAGLIDDGARIFRQWLDHEARACVEYPTIDEIGSALCRYACGYRCDHPCQWSTTRLALAERITTAATAASLEPIP